MKKIYGDFNKQDWLQNSHLNESEVPETIILHGEDGNVTENIGEWESAFESIVSRPRWNMIVGKRRNKLIGFANVIWAPMTALIVHKFAMMGTKHFIQIGYCGSLSAHLNYGEILLVKSAKSEDGVSTQYFPNELEFFPGNNLFNKAEMLLKEKKYLYKTGSIVTTSAMFLETQNVVKNWQSNNYIGVDGETATTFAVAQKFGAEAISILTCSDHVALGDTLFNSDDDRSNLEEEAFGKIQNLALALSVL